MNSLVCVRCQEFIEGSEYRMVAVELPYYNVFFHLECYTKTLKEYGGWDGIGQYLAKNLDLWYNRENKGGKRYKKRGKTNTKRRRT